MLSLPNITLIALTNKDFEAHKEAMVRSSSDIKFGARKIIYDMDCTSIDEWNRKIIQELPRYVDTTHVLLVHADGYVINPHLWNPEWLDYDYIGAPWPLPTDNYSYRDEMGDLVRVGNSVSLRSKKLMDLVATQPWRSYFGNTNEDGFICCHNRKWLESKGCKFAPLGVAIHFSKEHTIPENQGLETFMYHALG